MVPMLNFRPVFILLLAGLFACGGLPGLGGGGGSSDVNDGNPADVRLEASPRMVDSGDIITVEVKISDVQGEFVLKIKHNEGLSYVPDSMLLFGEGNPGPNIPTPNDFSSGTEVRYLVVPFYVPAHFGKHRKGTLTFNFQAEASLSDKIEIDADEFDKTTYNGTNFDPLNPKFSTLDEVSIRVKE